MLKQCFMHSVVVCVWLTCSDIISVISICHRPGVFVVAAQILASETFFEYLVQLNRIDF